MRNALFVLCKALCGVLLLQIAIKYIFWGPVGYVLQFIEKSPVITASLMFFAGLVLVLQSTGAIYDAFSKKTKPKETSKKYQKVEITGDNLKPSVLLDPENKHIKIIGNHTLYDLYCKLLKLYIDVKYDKWTVSGQHETYINLPKCNSISSTYYRIGEQNQNLPTESICE